MTSNLAPVENSQAAAEGVAGATEPLVTAKTSTDAILDARPLTLRRCVEQTMQAYFSHLDGHDARDVYNMVLAEVEAPLLEVVMHYTHHNQSKAAEVLGLNRGTLRKKLKAYDLLR